MPGDPACWSHLFYDDENGDESETMTKTSKTAAVEKAVDLALAEHDVARSRSVWEQFDAILAQIDQVPDLPNAFDPLDWDEHGLPR